MSSQKEIYKDEEINIYELILIIWKNKLIILFSTLVFIAIMSGYLISQKPVVPVFKAETEINSISLFDNNEYQKYNDYISFNKATYETSTFKFDNKTLVFENWKLNYFENIRLDTIDKDYLYTLFVNKLENKEFLARVIKKSEIFNKEDFKSNEDYDYQIVLLLNSIKLTKSTKEMILLEAKTTDKKKWKNFLNLLESSINLEIQSYLKKSFSRYLLNQVFLKKHKIQDIEEKILLEKKNIEYVKWLNNQKKRLSDNKTLDRLQIAFNSTPIVRENQFLAGKINSEATKFKRSNKNKSKKSMILLAGLIGAILSTIYVIISRNIRKSPINI